MPNRNSTQICALSDGRAGNARQAEALAAALTLGDSHSLTLHPRSPWKLFSPRRLPGAHHAFGPAFKALLDVPPALAIGCGRQAALATRLLRSPRTRSIQILDPRLATRHWDIVVAPEHDAVRGDNVVTLLGSLHPVDDDWLVHARVAHAGFAELPGPRTTVLLGGTSRHARFDAAEFNRLADTVTDTLQRDGGSLLLTTSRRTPQAVRDAALARFADRPGVIWTGASDGSNPYPGMLAWADRIVCTADSVNMVSEAAATRAPVFVLEPSRMDGAPRRFLDALLARGRIRPVDAMLAAFDVCPLRETARVAAEIRTRLTPR